MIDISPIEMYLPENKLPSLSVEEIQEMLDVVLTPLHETQFYKEVFQLGLESGRQKAVWEGKRDLVLQLLARQCGEISIAQQAQIRSAAIGQLEALGEALLDFGGMADFEHWLQENLGV
jgi:predicted transposase YdaD